MASRNMMIGTGAALAGLGGLAAAALTVNGPAADPTPAQPTAQPVETRTVVIRKVEHRVKRVKARRPHPAARAATTPAAITPAVTAPPPAPVVQAAPVQVAAPAPAPVRTRTSGSHRSGENESERHAGSDDRGELQDD